MKNLKKSAIAIGRVFGLVMGDKFTSPVAHTLREHPSLQFGS